MTNRGVWRLLLAFVGSVIAPGQSQAQVSPEPLIAPVVFHWSQTLTPYPTLEGGSVADASEHFWRRQLEQLEGAGFTAQLFQVSSGSELSQRNHLRALRARRAEPRPLPPHVVPFLAAESFAVYDEPKDVRSPEGFEAFYQVVRAFFLMYAEAFPASPSQPAAFDRELLATVDGRVFIVLWFVPLTRYDLPSDFFERLSDRLEQDFGFRAYWSTHAAFAAGRPDDINFLFNGSAPIQYGFNPRYPAVDLLAAFWPPNLTFYRADLFAPRDGGTTYAAAWDAVIAATPRPVIVLVESYNEITEGSHLMPSWPVDHAPGDGHPAGSPDDPVCQTEPCHPVAYTDHWGPDNPWRFLDLTNGKIREWLEGPAPPGVDRQPPHVFIVTPKTDVVGSGLIPLDIIAADDQGLREIRVYVNGRLALVSPGRVNELMKSGVLGPGRHRLYVEAYDQAGNVGSDVSDFIVAAAPAAASTETRTTNRVIR